MLHVKVCIILPTYNERENIGLMLPQLLSLGRNFHVLVVDDSSPDGTSKIVSSLMKKETRLYLIVRTKKTGIGSAYKAGFAYAIQKIKPDVIIQMDADFSHRPQDVLKLLEKMGEYDVVVGSRYVLGSAISRWPIRRRIVSKAVNFFAKLITGLPEKDVSSGFKCFKKSALTGIRVDKLISNNRSFQFELLYQFKQAGLKIVEVPICFANRRRGKDTFSILETFDFIHVLFSYAIIPDRGMH